jgi:hypothetical protein
MERLDTPNEPQLEENQFIGADGRVRTDDITTRERKTLENLSNGENPFTPH